MAIEVTVTSALVGGGAAALISSGITAINLWLARRSEEGRQIRELAVRVAIENWKLYRDAGPEMEGPLPPLDVYLIHAMHLVSALDGRLKTQEQIRAHLRQGFAASTAATAEVEAYNKKLNAD